MAGLLNGKQLIDGSVTPDKLSERYLQVNEEGEVNGDLIVTGNTTLSETATYKGLEIATKGDLYDEGGITDLINELDEKKQNNLIAGENIDIASDGVTISSSTKVAGSDRVLTYDTAGLKANITLVTNGNHIRIEGKTDESGDPYILGEFNVLQSQIIDEVYIENGHLFITFIVDGDPGKEKVDIDLSEFIDIYEGSRYIDITGQEVSLKYSEVRDQLINDGMASTGEIPTDYVDLTSDQTIRGNKTFTGGVVSNYILTTGGKTHHKDGSPGVYITENGNIVSSSATSPGLYFTRGGSTEYTGYVSNESTGTISIFSRLNVNATGQDGYNLYVHGTTYTTGNITSAGTGYFTNLYKGDISVATINDIPAIPTRLANPNTLTFTGAVNATYDGSAPVTVNIPEGGVSGEFVDLVSDQTIGGVKTFNDVPVFNGGAINITAPSVKGATITADLLGLHLDGNLSAGEIRANNNITVYGESGTSEIRMMGAMNGLKWVRIESADGELNIRPYEFRWVYINNSRVLTEYDLDRLTNAVQAQATTLKTETVFETITNPTQLELGEVTTLRYENTSHTTGALQLSGGIEGKEYQYSINNQAAHDLTLTLPDGKEWVIAGGEFGVLKIYYFFGKYACKVIL